MLAKLRGLGKFNGQGYLYGRPEPAGAIRARLQKLNRLSGGNGSAANKEPRVALELARSTDGSARKA